jgi:perosamine synthetase
VGVVTDAIRRIPVAGPWVTDIEAKYVAEASLNDWYSGAAQSVGLFEREFAARIGVGHAAAVPHCTSALHLSLLALGVGPGDEVIVPETTWVATAAPISYVGAEPVFADIEAETWQLSAASIERCLSPRTKAIMTVDLYGGVPDMDAIAAITGPAGIPVVEDAAQAIGSTWRGTPAGGLGDIATFSFHGTKTLTTGEGGMLVTDRTDLFDRVAQLRDHGRTAADFKYFVTSELGYKYRMSSLQAAFGRAQLLRLDELLERKRQIFGWYAKRIGDIAGLTLNGEAPHSTNSYWMVTMVVDAAMELTTHGMMTYLDERMIDSRPFFPPLSSLGAWQHAKSSNGARERNPVAYDLSSRAINLPSALMLTEADVDRVCLVVREMVQSDRRRRSA